MTEAKMELICQYGAATLNDQCRNKAKWRTGTTLPVGECCWCDEHKDDNDIPLEPVSRPAPRADAAEVMQLAEAMLTAQQHYTSTWLDPDRDRCRRNIDAAEAKLKEAKAALAAALSGERQEETRFVSAPPKNGPHDHVFLWPDGDVRKEAVCKHCGLTRAAIKAQR